MSRIIHPQFQRGRSQGIAGTEFIDGFAEIDLEGDEVLREAFLQHGYIIEDAVRPAKTSKRSSRAKPAKGGKVSEPTSSAPADTDSGFAVVELSDGTAAVEA